jgi:hypothetical protein
MQDKNEVQVLGTFMFNEQEKEHAKNISLRKSRDHENEKLMRLPWTYMQYMLETWKYKNMGTFR